METGWGRGGVEVGSRWGRGRGGDGVGSGRRWGWMGRGGVGWVGVGSGLGRGGVGVGSSWDRGEVARKLRYADSRPAIESWAINKIVE